MDKTTGAFSYSGDLNQFASDLQRLAKADSLQTWLTQNSKAAKAFGNDIQAMIISLRSAREMTLPEFQKLDAEFLKIQAQAQALGKTGLTFSDTLKQGFSGLFSMSSVLSGGLKAVRSMIEAAAGLEAAQTRLANASGLNARKLAQVTGRALDLGETVAKSGSQVLDTLTLFQRAGYDLEAGLAMTEAASLLSNIAGGMLDTSEAAGILLSVLQGFQLSGTDPMPVVDKLAAVSTRSAIGFDQLANGLAQISGSMNRAGNTMDQTLGMLAGGYARLGNMEQAAEGLALVQQRLHGMDAAGGSIPGLSAQLTQSFGEIGIRTAKADGSLRSLYEIAADYARVLPSLTADQKQFYGELAAGAGQLSVWNAITEQISLVEEAAALSGNALGSASEENQKYLATLTGKTAGFEAAFQRLAQTVIDSDLVAFFLDLGTVGMKAIDGLINAITPLGAVIGAGAGAKNIGKYA